MKYKLRLFFLDVIKMAMRCPNRKGWESTVDWLIEQMVLYNDQCISTMVNAVPNDTSNEARLNNVGLKMYWRMSYNNHLVIHIGGDQADKYPEFVEKFRELVIKHGLYEK